jgi:hypothetical protein
VIRDPEEIRVFEENRVKEAKKDIWVIEDHQEIRVQLESPEVRVSQVRLDYQVIRVTKGTKERLDPWAIKEIRVRWVCRENQENQVIQVALEKLEREEQLVFQEKGAYQVIRVCVEIRATRVKGVNKEREDYRANRVSVEIAVNRVRRGQLERKEFQEIRDPEGIRVSAAIRGRMEILDQWENLDYRENRVKKDCQVTEENRVTRDHEDIEVINYKIIILFRIWEDGSRVANLKKKKVAN